MSAVSAPSRHAIDPSSEVTKPADTGDGDWRPFLILGAILVVVGIWLMYITRGATFHYDEWSFIVDRPGLGLHTLFAPHNEHVSTVPILVFKALLHTVGLRHYWPYQVLPIALELVTAALVYALARASIGAWAALVPALVVAAFGAAWQDVLWPFQIGYMIPVATTLGALLLLRRRSALADFAACGLLIVGTFSSSVGLPLDLGVACALLFDQQRWLRLARTVLLPIVLYAVWSHYWGVLVVQWQRALTVPAALLDRLSENLTALTATPDRYGAALAIGLLAIVVFHVVTRRNVSQTLVAAGIGAVMVWAAQAMFRPGVVVSRYFQAPGVLLVLVIVELFATYRLSLPSIRVLAVAALALVAVMAGQASAYLIGARQFRDWGRFTDSSLAAMQIAGSRANPSFRPDPVRMPQLTTHKYALAVHDYGSPAPDVAQLRRLPEDARENADSVLAAALGIAPTPAPRPATATATACQRVAPGPRGTQVRLPDAGLWFKGPAGTVVRLRRFGDRYPPQDLPPGHAIFSLWVIPGEHRVFLHTPVYHLPAAGTVIAPGADGAPQVPWMAEISSARSVEVCRVA